MQNVFGYVRVSTSRQAEKGVSLDEQRDAIKRYCAQHDLQIARWFEEQVTAAKRGRKEFNEMVRLLRRGEVEGVVIHKIDRSARNLRDWADMGELIDMGVKVRFANDNVDMTTRGGRLTADIQAVVAADFIRNNREEVKKGMDGRLKQGLWPFAAPVGYLDRGKGHIKAVNPKKAPLVRKAFELYATGTYTLETLVEAMARYGLTNRHGKPFSVDGLWVILRNSFYIGIMRVRRTGATYPGLHQAIIPTSLFEQVQAVLEGRSYTHVQKNDFLFRRRFRCATCGLSLVASRQKGHIYYRCHRKSCPTTSLREEAIDSAVCATLEGITFPIELRAMLHVLLRHRAAQSVEAVKAQKASLLAAMELHTGRLGRLTDAYIDGAIDRELFEERKAPILRDQARLRDELAAFQADAAELTSRAEAKVQLAEAASLLYKLGNDLEKRDLLDRLTHDRTATGKTIAIARLPPFEGMAKVLISSKCAHLHDRATTAENILHILSEL